MARKQRPPLKESDAQGMKFYPHLSKLLKRLHGSGCERDRAGNRQLHYDQYCLLVLLAIYSPLISSLHALEQATGFKKVQDKLGVRKTSYGSLAEAVQVFDPQLLKPIVEQLAAELRPLTVGRDPRLVDVRQAITLVDSTMLVALPRIAAAAWGGKPISKRDFAWRLHTHFEVLTGTLSQVDLTGFRNAGEESERQVLKRRLESDRCYVFDRGYQGNWLFNAIHAAGSSYVARVAEDSWHQVEREYPLSAEARAQGIVHDAIVTFGRDAHPDHPVRLITLEVTPHQKRSGHKGDAGPANKGLLLILTNLLDVPAEIIALLYEFRWQIELFFRFFKCTLGCSHLLSHHQNGVLIQSYCAIIACLLITLYSGCKPNKRTYEMICWYLAGVADDEELEAHLNKLKVSAQ